MIVTLFSTITQQSGMEELISFLKLLHQCSILPPAEMLALNNQQTNKEVTLKDSERLDTVLKYVMANFRGSLDSKTAAKLTFLNEAAFCRFFKKRMEQTFSQFVNHVRITHAKSLLLKKDWDVLRVCYDSGFNSLSYFNRQFRESTGKSPKEYRKSFHSQLECVMMDYQDD